MKQNYFKLGNFSFKILRQRKEIQENTDTYGRTSNDGQYEIHIDMFSY